MSFLSSSVSDSLKSVVTMMAADIEAGAISHERCATFAAAVQKVAVDAAAEVKVAAKKVKTTKTTVSDATELLAPVDAGTVVATVPASRDPYASHKYRLATIDDTLCMGRKIDEKNPVPGTRKGDAGASIKMYPEKQCPKKSLPGQKLCKICNEKAQESNANPAAVPTGYFGRLDEPLFHMARVIGCGYFFEKYPNGLAEDPTTAPVETTVAEPKVAESKAAEPKVAKTKVAKPKVAKPKVETTAEPKNDEPVAETKAADPKVAKTKVAETVVEPNAAETKAAEPKAAEPKAKKPRAKKLTTTNTTVAASDQGPVKPEWVTFLYESRVHIRNLKDGRTYEADCSKTEHEQMVKKDSYKGRWRDGALDIYTPEEDDAE
jgi:hypothetical protein